MANLSAGSNVGSASQSQQGVHGNANFMANNASFHGMANSNVGNASLSQLGVQGNTNSMSNNASHHGMANLSAGSNVGSASQSQQGVQGNANLLFYMCLVLALTFLQFISLMCAH